jgi:hypothetical protein
LHPLFDCTLVPRFDVKLSSPIVAFPSEYSKHLKRKVGEQEVIPVQPLLLFDLSPLFP